MRVCTICGARHQGSKKGPSYCSISCKLTGIDKINKCLPECKETDLDVREILFKDETNHLQQYCHKCLKTKFLPKEWGIRSGLIEKPQEVDFLTEVAKDYKW